MRLTFHHVQEQSCSRNRLSRESVKYSQMIMFVDECKYIIFTVTQSNLFFSYDHVIVICFEFFVYFKDYFNMMKSRPGN